ncbi:hypothetical protein Mgra_00001015 [Meloidogyne graminicola]|uniref:Uncharacterized protein n=1 Tax=Meloidogyne graminicola TaxID=189291 RepID=A0A8T0A0X5_9BILA|nr:hypothetical protein Mgra_00001015 [Meloidogyne graminicola]
MSLLFHIISLVVTNTILLHTSKGMPPYLFVALPFCCPYLFVALPICCYTFLLFYLQYFKSELNQSV